MRDFVFSIMLAVVLTGTIGVSSASDFWLESMPAQDGFWVMVDVQENDVISFELKIKVDGEVAFFIAKGDAISDWMLFYNYKEGHILIAAASAYPMELGRHVLLEVSVEIPTLAAFVLVGGQVNERPVGLISEPIILPLPPPPPPFPSSPMPGTDVLGLDVTVPLAVPTPEGGGGTRVIEPRSDYGNDEPDEDPELQIVCDEWVGKEEKSIRVGQTLEMRAESGDSPYAWEVGDPYGSNGGTYNWDYYWEPRNASWFGKKTRQSRNFSFTIIQAPTGWSDGEKLRGDVFIKLTLVDRWNSRKRNGDEQVTVKIRLLLAIGDVNADKKLTIEDAELIQQFLNGQVELSPTQQEAADVNGDGKVDDNDLAVIEKYLTSNLAPARSALVSPRNKQLITWAKIRAR